MKKIIMVFLISILLTSCGNKMGNENFEEYNEYISLPNNWQVKNHGVYGDNYSDLTDYININKIKTIEEFEERIHTDFNFWATSKFRLTSDWSYEYYTDGGGDITDFTISTGNDEYGIIKGKIILSDQGYEYIAVATKSADNLNELISNVFK